MASTATISDPHSHTHTRARKRMKWAARCLFLKRPMEPVSHARRSVGGHLCRVLRAKNNLKTCWSSNVPLRVWLMCRFDCKKPLRAHSLNECFQSRTNLAKEGTQLRSSCTFGVVFQTSDCSSKGWQDLERRFLFQHSRGDRLAQPCCKTLVAQWEYALTEDRGKPRSASFITLTADLLSPE
eukprot:1779508-Amphidinium_carterae.8